MARIAEFLGIVIRINHRDHNPAHFHARIGQSEALIEIETLAVYSGSIPGRELKLVLGWAAKNQEALRTNWARAQRGETLLKID